MLERAQMRAAPDRIAIVQIAATSGTTVLRLKSCSPEYTNGGKPVALGGGELPSQVGETLSGPIRVLCVGPGEWLILSREYPASNLRERIEPCLPQQSLMLVDLTDGLAGIEVQGSAAREVLSKGCGLDLHPHSFPVGRCARTRLAQIPVVIGCLDDSSRFELYVARSYLRYLHAWLTDAAAEF